MIEDIEAGIVTHVVVVKLDRLSRSWKDNDYDPVQGILVPNDEAKMVRHIYDRYLAGAGMRYMKWWKAGYKLVCYSQQRSKQYLVRNRGFFLRPRRRRTMPPGNQKSIENGQTIKNLGPSTAV